MDVPVLNALHHEEHDIPPVERHTRLLLLATAVVGALGWVATYLFGEVSALSIETTIYVTVAAWAAVTAASVAFVVRSAPRKIRRSRAWTLWVPLTALGLAVNAVANTPSLVVPAAGAAAFKLLQEWAYLHPWIAIYAVGYVATAVVDRPSPLMDAEERQVYLFAGVACLGFLLTTVAVPEAINEEHTYAFLAASTGVPPMVALNRR